MSQSKVCEFCGMTTRGNEFQLYEVTGDGDVLYICPDCSAEQDDDTE